MRAAVWSMLVVLGLSLGMAVYPMGPGCPDKPGVCGPDDWTAGTSADW